MLNFQSLYLSRRPTPALPQVVQFTRSSTLRHSLQLLSCPLVSAPGTLPQSPQPILMTILNHLRMRSVLHAQLLFSLTVIRFAVNANIPTYPLLRESQERSRNVEEWLRNEPCRRDLGMPRERVGPDWQGPVGVGCICRWCSASRQP